jgi:hypothetical protein
MRVRIVCRCPRGPRAGNREVGILYNAAMDLWVCSTEQDVAQMGEEARAIAGLHSCGVFRRLTHWYDFRRTEFLQQIHNSCVRFRADVISEEGLRCRLLTCSN